MAYRNIVKNGDQILKKKSRPVEKFDTRLAELIDDMIETMYLNEGVGLAAVQVGTLKRAIVLDVGEGVFEMINPKILEQEGEQVENEGCLSFPGESCLVKRPMSVKVKFQDRNGKWFVKRAEGLFSRCVCHEMDHLEGIVFLDRKEPEADKETQAEEK